MKPLLLCVLLVFPPMARAGASHQAILEALYNGQLTRSDSLITASIIAHPDLPDYYVLKAHHAFYARFFSPAPLSRDSMLAIIDYNSRKAVELAERESAHRQNKFYLGSAYDLLSRVHVMRQEFWDGYWTARKSRNYLEDVVKEDSTFCDAYVGLGIIAYYPTRRTGIQAALSWLAGMGGNREEGLKYFHKASSGGSLLKSEATLILAYVMRTFEADFATANTLFGSLHGEFPGNEYFDTQSLQAGLGARIEQEGAGFLGEDIPMLQQTYRIGNSGVLNTMAYVFLGRRENATALELFRVNIELYPDEANPYDSIAECHTIMGNNPEAIRYSRIALEKLAGDSTINEEFRENLREILEDRLRDLGAGPGV